MSFSKSFEFTAAVRGFNIHRNVWPPQLNENLVHPHEEMNLFDIFAIKTCRRTSNEIVGYLPQELHK